MLKNRLLWLKRQRLWRSRNLHNTTMVSGVDFSMKQVSVGQGTYGAISALIFSDIQSLSVGSYCSIAPNVSFIVSADHSINMLSTFPYKVKILGEKYEATSKGNIIVGDDVWIGQNSIVLSGIQIGQGAVIAAGAVVTKDIPPYAIAAGVPARVIKYRFSEPVIDFLLTLDYSQLTEAMIRTHIDDLYTPLDSLPLENIKALYSWFPKKDVKKTETS